MEISRNRGFRVLLPRAHDIEEIFEIRLALEPRPRAGWPSGERTTTSRSCAPTWTRCAEPRGPGRVGVLGRRPCAARPAPAAAGNGRAAEIVASLRATTALLGPPTTATGRTLREIRASTSRS